MSTSEASVMKQAFTAKPENKSPAPSPAAALEETPANPAQVGAFYLKRAILSI